MALLTKKEISDLCGLETKNLSVYITRGKVIVGKDDLIDTTIDKNKAFIEKRKGKVSDVKIQTPTVIESKINSQPQEQSEGQSYTESERQLKYLDTIKRQKEIEKLEIEIQKKKGEVVPSELIKPVFLQHNQSIITEFKNATDEIIRIFSKKRSLTVEEVAEIKGETTETINNAINKAIISTVKAVESIVLEHQDKKNVGEHG